MSTLTSRLEKKLQDQFTPSALKITNESHKHAGHHEAFDGTGETHFHIYMISPLFEGLSRIDRSRLLYQALETELSTQIHALALELKSPSEAT